MVKGSCRGVFWTAQSFILIKKLRPWTGEKPYLGRLGALRRKVRPYFQVSGVRAWRQVYFLRFL